MNAYYRTLITLKGDDELIEHQVAEVIKSVPGDWIIIASHLPVLWQSSQDISLNSVEPKLAKVLLGQEFKHAIFDARYEFNLDALAIITGALVAGSLLILLLPNDMTAWYDQDSLRWNEQASACRVPQFITHFTRILQQQISRNPEHIFSLQMDRNNSNQDLRFFIENIKFTANSCVFHQNNEQELLLQQQLIPLAQAGIKDPQRKIVILTAKRGRGKSALAGMFAQHYQCWVTAPNKNSVTTLTKFAKHNATFYAPDKLIEELQQSTSRPDWLIIDEAAMIPLPMVTKLINQPYNVLLTTTVDGYEGTGQGLLLKLFKQLEEHEKVTYYTLNTPIRWPEHDPLESFIDNLLVAQKNTRSDNLKKMSNHLAICKLTQKQLVESPLVLQNFFGLLKSAHYRTTLIDLRRLLDANNLDLYAAQYDNNIVGVLMAIKEGQLDATLAEDVLKGYRRPRGNLVAQSLVAHAGELQAAMLSSVRINRIATQEDLRLQGIARQLISQLIVEAKTAQNDFISVSFAYSDNICAFWLKQGFSIVHVGTHQDASSGSHAVMAIYPISAAGVALTQKMQKKLARNWYWLQKHININLPIEIDGEQNLTANDRYELSLFATTSYAYSACLAVLSRLAYQIQIRDDVAIKCCAPLLLETMVAGVAENKAIKQHHLSGKKELIKLLRKEIQQLITFQELFNE